MTEEAEKAKEGAAVQAGFPKPKGQCRAFLQGAWGEGLGHSLAGAGSTQPGRHLVRAKPVVPVAAPLLPPPGCPQLGPQGARSMPHEHPMEGGPSSLCGGEMGLGRLCTLPKETQVELSPSRRLSGPEPCFLHPTHCYPLWDTWRCYRALAPRLFTSFSQLGPLPPGTLSGKSGAWQPLCQKCST